MSEIKVGDKVRRISDAYEGVVVGTVGTVVCAADNRALVHKVRIPGHTYAHNWSPEYCEKVCETEPMHPAAEKPVRVNLRLRMATYFQENYKSTGHTGTELAKALDAKLNSVTPRFAELRKLGIIRAHEYLKRNGETVWVLA